MQISAIQIYYGLRENRQKNVLRRNSDFNQDCADNNNKDDNNNYYYYYYYYYHRHLH